MKNSIMTAVAMALIQVGAPAWAGVSPSGDPVLYWNEVAMANIDGDPGLGGRSYAMVDVALHDAINATMGSPDQSYVGNVKNAGGDTRAAAAVAAHDVLASLYPAKAATFDAALAASLATVPSGSAKTTGIATGQAFAAAAVALRAGDGFNNPFPPYSPTGAPGNYVPTSPPMPAADGQFATATPFIMTSQTQFRQGPPPALDGSDGIYAAALNEVESLGAADSKIRTADETFSAKFWEKVPETPYLTAAINQSIADGKSMLDNARIFATLTTAIADAPIAAFDTKYLYDFWRPVTAIHEADIDGNPLTIADPDWQPLLFTPPFPGYFSAHSIVAGTAASILDLEYGTSNSFCFTNGVGSRCWDNYDAAALDDSKSREWGGVHFSFDDATGLSTGYELGTFAFNRNLFGAVPEPSSWAMMMIGFGIAGWVLRANRESIPTARQS